MEPDNIFELKGKMPTKDGFLTQALLKKYFTRAKVASLHKDKEYSRIEMLWRDNFKAIDAKFWQYAEGIDTKGVPKHIQPNIVNPEWIARIKPYLRTWIWITRAEAGGTSQPATDVRIYLWHEHHVQCIFHVTTASANMWQYVTSWKSATIPTWAHNNVIVLANRVSNGGAVGQPALVDGEPEELDPRHFDDTPAPPLSDEDAEFLAEAAEIINRDEGTGNTDGDGSNSTDKPAVGFLPPNLFSGFGGLDASYAFGSLESFRPNVFDLDISNPAKSKTLRCTGTDGTANDYSVPNYLNFTWGTESTFFSASGSSKVEFIHDLSHTVDLGFELLGFGAEFERTFKQHNKEETFNKYVARYDQEIVYKVEFKDKEAAKQYLSADFKNALKTWSVERLVDQFGTHYMTTAWFGGLRIHSSTIDQLDTLSKTELTEALTTKIPLVDPDGVPIGNVTNNPGRTESTTRSLMESMKEIRTTTVGGTAPDGDLLENWRRTLSTNPSVVLYKLKPIDTLVEDPAKRNALKEAIKRRLAQGQPIDGCNLLAIRVPLKPYYSDRDSRGKYDISVAYPDVPKGWYAVGQFGQSAALENAFWGHSYAIAVRGNPNFELDADRPFPALFGATSTQRRWCTYRQGNQYGMFTPVFDTPYEEAVLQKYPKLRSIPGSLKDQYLALGDVFEPAAESQAVPQHALEKVACFHRSCLKELPRFPPKVWMWDDTNTRGSPDVTVMGAPNLIMPDGKTKEPRQMVIQAPETGPSYLFKCLPRGDDGSGQVWYTLDWDKVKWLENKWMADIPGVSLRARL